jgi:hypothetical protein
MTSMSDNGAYPKNAASRPARSSRPVVPLPAPSGTAHVTLSGGLLAGPDVLRVHDTNLPTPDKIEVGAQVELQDGTRAEVVKVRAKRLTAFGLLQGSVEVKLSDGRLISASRGEIARVLAPAG